MATFVAKNSGEVKQKLMIILKEFVFIRVSFNKPVATATDRRARIHNEIREQPSFFVKL